MKQMQQPTEDQARWALSNVPLGSVRSARTIEVIQVESVTGLGIPDSPVRQVTEWFLPDGTRIGKWDHYEQSEPTY